MTTFLRVFLPLPPKSAFFFFHYEFLNLKPIDQTVKYLSAFLLLNFKHRSSSVVRGVIEPVELVHPLTFSVTSSWEELSSFPHDWPAHFQSHVSSLRS